MSLLCFYFDTDAVQNLSSSESSEFDESTEEEEDEEEDSCKDSEATCEDNISEDSEATQTESFKSNFPHFECVIGESVVSKASFNLAFIFLVCILASKELKFLTALGSSKLHGHNDT